MGRIAVHLDRGDLAVVLPSTVRAPAAAPVRPAQRGHHRHQPAPLHRPGRLLAARRRPAHTRPGPPLPRLAQPPAHRPAHRQPRTAEDTALAAYSILNGAVAVTLLAAAGFFWYQLFGDLAATLARYAPPRLADPRRRHHHADHARPYRGRPPPARRRYHFPQTARRSHLPAAVEVAHSRHPPPRRSHPPAGHPRLPATRHHPRAILAAPAADTPSPRPGHRASYGLLRAGTITASESSGHALILTPGATWSPHHTLRHASRRAILIDINAHVIGAPGPCGDVCANPGLMSRLGWADCLACGGPFGAQDVRVARCGLTRALRWDHPVHDDGFVGALARASGSRMP